MYYLFTVSSKVYKIYRFFFFISNITYSMHEQLNILYGGYLKYEQIFYDDSYMINIIFEI